MCRRNLLLWLAVLSIGGSQAHTALGTEPGSGDRGHVVPEQSAAINQKLTSLFKAPGPLAELAIQFRVEDGGEVRLQGSVDRPIYKRLVREVVRSLPGVTGIDARQLTLTHAQDTVQGDTQSQRDLDSNSVALMQLAVELIHDPATEQLAVACEKGQIKLSGTVQLLARKEYFARLAKSLCPDRSISNQIDVQPLPRDDALLQLDLQQRLTEEPRLNALELQVEVVDAHAIISGKVPDFNTKARVGRVATAITGLARLSNHTTVAWSPHFSDDGLRRELIKRMEEAGVEGLTIQVVRGVATVSGVLDPQQLSTAQKVAGLTDGLRSVQFTVQVAGT
jgi:osmotically-inducible protein OsmY